MMMRRDGWEEMIKRKKIEKMNKRKKCRMKTGNVHSDSLLEEK